MLTMHMKYSVDTFNVAQAYIASKEISSSLANRAESHANDALESLLK